MKGWLKARHRLARERQAFEAELRQLQLRQQRLHTELSRVPPQAIAGGAFGLGMGAGLVTRRRRPGRAAGPGLAGRLLPLLAQPLLAALPALLKPRKD